MPQNQIIVSTHSYIKSLKGAQILPTSNEQNQLNMLSIFHFIFGGFGCLASLGTLIYVIFGALFVAIDLPNKGLPNDAKNFIGYLAMSIGSIVFITILTLSILTIYSGVQLRNCKKHTFSMVIASILCLSIPFGTILGVFTLVVLSKKEVKELYAHKALK